MENQRKPGVLAEFGAWCAYFAHYWFLWAAVAQSSSESPVRLSFLAVLAASGALRLYFIQRVFDEEWGLTAPVYQWCVDVALFVIALALVLCNSLLEEGLATYAFWMFWLLVVWVGLPLAMEWDF